MDVSFAITGKAGAKGVEIWGMSDEDISNRIYQHSKREAKEASRLEIELREHNNHIYSYYTFLKINNVAQVKTKEDEEKQEKHGRKGSFFGMTIRIEKGFIQNVADFYLLCESAFDNLIFGRILTDIDTDGYLTYLIEKLSDGEDCFKRVEKELVSGVNNCGIIDLPDDCVIQKKTTDLLPQHFNIEDVEDKSFLEVLFKNSEVCVSREYDTFAVIEGRRKQKGEVKNKQDEKQEKQEEMVSFQKKIQYPNPNRSHRDNGFNSKKKKDLDFKLLITIGMNAITLILVFVLWHKYNSLPQMTPQMTKDEISQMINDEIKAYYSNIVVNSEVNSEENNTEEVNNEIDDHSSTQQNEQYKVCHLDINDNALEDTGRKDKNDNKIYRLKKDTLVTLTIRVKNNDNKNEDGVGCGELSCDPNLSDIRHEGSKFYFKIPNECTSSKITFTYKYFLNGEEKMYQRTIDLK